MGPLPRISPVLPTTDAEFQAVMREFNALIAVRPTTDAEWQQLMKMLGLEGIATPTLPLTDADWQAGFVRVV